MIITHMLRFGLESLIKPLIDLETKEELFYRLYCCVSGSGCGPGVSGQDPRRSEEDSLAPLKETLLQDMRYGFLRFLRHLQYMQALEAP